MDVVSVSVLFRLDFGTVAKVWYFLLFVLFQIKSPLNILVLNVHLYIKIQVIANTTQLTKNIKVVLRMSTSPLAKDQ